MTFACNGAKGDTGETGPPGPPGTGGTAIYKASINQFGNAGLGNSPEFVRAVHLSAGRFVVYFSNPVANCPRLATLGVTAGSRNNSAFFTPVNGQISTYAELVDENGTIVNNGIGVGTFDGAGAPADKAFHLVVFC